MPLRVLQGLVALSSFLVEQAARIAPSAPVSAERKRIAIENVPWDVVADPGALARELRKLVLSALGEEQDQECNTPPKNETPPYEAEPVDAPRASKRKASKAELKPPPHKFKNWSPAGSNKVVSPVRREGDGAQVDRRVIPVETRTTREMRVDPSAPELGERVAEVVTKTTTTIAVLKRKEGVRGEVPVVETRTVATTIEVVRFIPDLEAPSMVTTSTGTIPDHLAPVPSPIMAESSRPRIKSPFPGMDMLSAIASSLPPSSSALPTSASALPLPFAPSSSSIVDPNPTNSDAIPHDMAS